MSEVLGSIRSIEDEIEKALWSLEVAGQLEEALASYRLAERKLDSLCPSPEDPGYPEVQRVLSYCLMRQGNVLRELGRESEAAALGERELQVAQASGDGLTMARSLMSFGIGRITKGKVEEGLRLLEEARIAFQGGTSIDYRQGEGWCWVIRADLINAGILPGGADAVVEACDRALSMLLPIQNWPGVARAYAARAKAYETTGNLEAAAEDREVQAQYEVLIEKDHP